MSWVLVAATAVSATAAVVGGAAKKSQEKVAADQYEKNAQLAKLGADQEEALRREDLNSTLSAIDAIRTSRNLDVASPTGMAIRERTNYEGERGIAIAKLNALGEAQSYRSQAAISRSEGNSALVSGFLKAGSSVLSSGLINKKPSG